MPQNKESSTLFRNRKRCAVNAAPVYIMREKHSARKSLKNYIIAVKVVYRNEKIIMKATVTKCGDGYRLAARKYEHLCIKSFCNISKKTKNRFAI